VTGTLLNVAAVLVGTTVGTLLGDRLPDRVRTIAMHGVGLVSLLIGIQMALQVQNILIVLASMVLGGIAGELLGIEDRLEGLGRVLEERWGMRTRSCAASSSAASCSASARSQSSARSRMV
jgi:uncharacterized protein